MYSNYLLLNLNCIFCPQMWIVQSYLILSYLIYYKTQVNWQFREWQVVFKKNKPFFSWIFIEKVQWVKMSSVFFFMYIFSFFVSNSSPMISTFYASKLTGNSYFKRVKKNCKLFVWNKTQRTTNIFKNKNLNTAG